MHSQYRSANLFLDDCQSPNSQLLRIYKRGPLIWHRLLQVDPGREFIGAVNQLLAKNGVSVRRGRVNTLQGIVERFNRTLGERLFGHQYAQELLHVGLLNGPLSG